MFNLPWYSWFNVLAIPIVMVCIWADYLLKEYKPWTRHLVAMQSLACVATIFLFWNASMFSTLVPVNYLLFLLVTALYVRTIGEIVVELSCMAKLKLSHSETPESAATEPSSCSLQNIDFDSDVLELDDEGESENYRNVAENLPKLFDRSASGGDKMKSAFSLFGVSLEEDDMRNSEGYFSSVWIYGFALAIVLTPPLWMSMTLLGWFK